MDRIRQMQVFIQVMESGNFTRAADALSIPRSTVSTVIQTLEDRLKTQLLLRTTRKVVPTQEGRQFLETARDIVDAVSASETMFRSDSLQVGGRIRIDVPSRIGRRILLPELPMFLRDHPDLTIELSASDRLVDLVGEGVDCALRLSVLEDSELVCRSLGEVEFVTCASRGYLAEHGIPQTLGDLASHCLINYAPHFPASSPSLDFLVNGENCRVEMQSTVAVDGAEPYIAAAAAGLGLIQVPLFDVRDSLTSGTLVEVLPDVRPPCVPLSFLFVKRRNLSPKVRIFQAWLESVLKRHDVFGR